jgi:2-amino-4-hydroxy-6-hydroxymethyldihydropteridine diphosphokinase
MEFVYIGIGSNLGDREENIFQAEEKISQVLSETRYSRLYETLPRYHEKQPLFLNAVISGLSQTEPAVLLEYIHTIEYEAGRDRDVSGWMGPRPIDLDILLFGERITNTAELSIPHPRMKERGFVLIPLLELNPLITDPVSGTKFSDFEAKLPRQGIYYHTVKKL